MDNRLTTNQGAPDSDSQSPRMEERHGPVLEDYPLLEAITRFDREPERVAYARGAGAHGVFVTEHGMAEHTKANFLAREGLETPVFVRFSTVIHGTGSPETARDPRGFAVKFSTQEGQYDLVGYHLPVYFIRDAVKFPDMAQALKPAPHTNIQDPSRYWDFMTLSPESTHMLTWLFSDFGTPATYREMDGFGVHTFKWVNTEGRQAYVKYRWQSLQGVRNFTAQEAAEMQAKDFNYATRDLYEAIELGRCPKWELYVQLMTPEQFELHAFDPLDPTKVWPEDIYPLHKVGTMTLTRNPINYFADVEQSAFAPGALVPGIELAGDQLLQGRLVSYPDTKRYCLDAGYLNIPVNGPYAPVRNRQRGGVMTVKAGPSSGNGAANSSSGKPQVAPPEHSDLPATLQGEAGRRRSGEADDFTQAGELYRSWPEELQARLLANLSNDLKATDDGIRLRAVRNFLRADRTLGLRLAEALGVDIRFVPQS